MNASELVGVLRQQLTASMFLKIGDLVSEMDSQRKQAADLIEAQSKALEEMHRRNDELNREISGVRRSYWDERAKARKLTEALASHSKEGEQ